MTELRTQSRLASLSESIGNVVIGIFIQGAGQAFLFYVMHIAITGHQFLFFTLVMTVLSVVRSYCLRRMWNAEWWKRFKHKHPTSYGPEMPPYCVGCQCVFDVATQKIVHHGCTCGHTVGSPPAWFDSNPEGEDYWRDQWLAGDWKVPEETPESIRGLTPEQLAERVNKLSPEDHKRLGLKLGL